MQLVDQDQLDRTGRGENDIAEGSGGDQQQDDRERVEVTEFV
jgi:hypothetical protein